MEDVVIKKDILITWKTDAKSITIPNNVRKVRMGAFLQAPNLKEILVDKENEKLASFDGVLFTKNMKTLVAYPKSREGEEYTIPEGVVHIGGYAFNNINELKKLILPSTLKDNGTNTTFRNFANVDELVVPEGVTKIDEGWFMCCNVEKISLPSTLEEVDDYTFCTCYAKEISVHKENKHFKFKNGCLYDYEGKTLIRCFDDKICETDKVMKGVEKFCPSAFICCGNLRRAEIPKGVTEMPCQMFWGCTSLEEVKLPSTVESISMDVFYDTKIKEMTLPDSVKKIFPEAFGSCNELEKIVLPDDVECMGDICGENYFVDIYCKENSKVHESVKKHMPANKVKFL